MKTNITILPIFIVAIILSACSFGLSSSQVDLDGSAWALTAIDNDSTITRNIPTLEFEDDTVSGNASCNIYSGSYQVEGETISFGPLVRTEMYCMEPEGVMDQEQTYLEILGAAQRFELTENI
jgi:heat shock protein HslJ